MKCPGKVQSRTVLHIFLPLLRTRDGVDNGSECPPLGCQHHPEKENRHGQKKVRWNRNLLKIVYSFVHIHSSLSRIPWCKMQPQWLICQFFGIRMIILITSTILLMATKTKADIEVGGLSSFSPRKRLVKFFTSHNKIAAPKVKLFENVFMAFSVKFGSGGNLFKNSLYAICLALGFQCRRLFSHKRIKPPFLTVSPVLFL